MSADRLELIIDPHPPTIAAAAVLVVLAIVLYRRTLPPLGRGRRAVLAILRMSAFALLLLFLLEPALVSVSAERREPVVPVLLDRSGSMALGDANGATRFDRAAGAARGIAGILDGARTPVVPFSDGAGEPLGPLDPLPIPDGEGTDIADAIESTLRRYQGANLSAVVLITDGRVTRGITGTVPSVPVPVFAVGCGDTVESAGLAVEEVEYPRTSYLGVRERITAVIRYSLPSGGAAAVRLIDNGKVIGEFASGPLRGEGRLDASFEWVPPAEGIRRLEVRALPAEGEVFTADNVEQIRISVRADRLGILLVDRHPDWEMTFLGALAARSPRLVLETVFWTPDGGYRLASGAPWTAPAGAGALSAYDLVILGDGSPFGGQAAAAALAGFVSNGGGLLLLASERSLLFDAAARGELAGTIPLRAGTAARFSPGEFPVRQAPDGGELLSRLSAQEARFERLPPLPAAALGFEPTAGAAVPFVIEADGRIEPLLAIQRSGEGVCAVMTGTGLYRWRLAGPEGAEAYRVLVSGLVEYLAGGYREPGLALTADRTVYLAGERIRIEALAADRRAGGVVRGEVVPMEGGDPAAAAAFLFRPDMERPGLYEAELDPLPPGEYELRGTLPAAAGPPAEGATRIAVEPVSVELLRTSQDRIYLERIAASTGGAFVDPDRIEALGRLIPLETDTVETRTVRSLRGSPLLLAGILAALAVEWFLRKIWGLV